jgi:hypothetical protein
VSSHFPGAGFGVVAGLGVTDPPEVAEQLYNLLIFI